MSLNNYRKNPEYPDRYTRNTGWKKVLPVQGRPIQTAELIEVQSILQDNIKQGFNTLFKNGSVIKGLRTSILNIQTDNISVVISAGQIYIEGQILDVSETVLNIPSNGLYNIDVIISESIIDETVDSSLRDPIKGSFTLGTPGASRLIWDTSINFSREDDFVINGYAIAQVSNGIILQKEINPFYEVEKSVAQFVYEKSGNFCVDGFLTNYIGFDKKIGSDVSKQQELQVAVQQAKDSQQSALSNAITQQTRISNLESQLNQATINVIVDPSTYQPIIARLSAELADARLTQAQYSEDLIDSSKSLNSANTDLKNIEAIITDQQIISISPGVAYVEGYRVAINSATKLYIPQSFPTKTVENASFTYRAESSQTLRTFSINDGSDNILVPQNNYINLELKFDDINNNNSLTPELTTNKFSVEIKYKIAENTLLTTVLSNLENVLRGTAQVPDNITFTIRDEDTLNSNSEITTKTTIAGSTFLTTEEKRLILSKYIIGTRNSDTLIFKAQSSAIKPKEIIVSVVSNLHRIDTDALVNFSTGIIITPDTTPLSEELSKSTYKLGFTPVNKITRLISDLQTETTLIRSEDGIDSINNEDTVLSIDSVEYQSKPGAPIVSYSSPLDFKLNRNKIEWELTRVGSIPKAGTSYRIKYTYTEVLVPEVDYILDRTTDSIKFIGRTPKINGRFDVDYSYFLSKAGVVTLDKDGQLGFSLSAASKNPIVPSVSEDKLPIASFIINSKDLILQQLDCKRQTVKDLYNLSEDIRVNKENNESLKLDLQTLKNAVTNPNQNEVIGIYSTTLNNLNKIDTVKTTAAFIPGIQAATSGFFSTELDLRIIQDNSLNKLKNPTNEIEYITIPFTEKLLFKQSRATKILEVKPKSKSIKDRANIYISEQVIFKNQGVKNTQYLRKNVLDENDDIILDENGDPVTEVVAKDYFKLPKLTSCDPLTKKGILFSSENEDSDIVQDIQSNIRSTIGTTARAISESIQKGTPTTLNTINSNDLLLEAFDNVFTRQIELDVTIDNLANLETGITILIDGTSLNIDPVKVYTGSYNSLTSTLQASRYGTLNLKVQIPENILTGTHTIEIYKKDRVYGKTNFYVFNNLLNQLVITPVKNWNAQPITVSSNYQMPLTKVDVFSEEIRIAGIDPIISNPEINGTANLFNNKELEFPLRYNTVNQTFVPTQNYFLTSAEFKVYSQPTDNNDTKLNLYLTSTKNNIPVKDKLSKAYIRPEQIQNTIVDLGAEGEYSKFTFRDLPLLNKNKKYNLALEANSASDSGIGYELYSAVVDEPDLASNTIVGNQLYLDGDLLTTTDGITLYQEDKEDLTFNLYRAEFENSHTIDLGAYSISLTNDPTQTSNVINYFCLNTRDIVPEGTDIIYKYSLSPARTDKIPFKPNSTICLNTSIPTIYLEAELMTNFTNIAPQLLVKGSSVSLYTVKKDTEVISNQITYPEAYKDVNITLQTIQPAGTEIKVYYSPTQGYDYEGKEWIELTLDESKTFVVNNALQLYEVSYTISEDDLFYYDNVERVLFRYKIELTANNGLTPIVRNITSTVS